MVGWAVTTRSSAKPLPGGPSCGAWGQVFSWAMRSRGVRGRCRPQWGQVQKLRRQSLYRSVSLCAEGVKAQGSDPPSPARPAWDPPLRTLPQGLRPWTQLEYRVLLKTPSSGQEGEGPSRGLCSQ